MNWQIMFTPEAQSMMDAIKDRRVKQKVTQRIDKLAEDPLKQGKSLGAELTDLYSVRAAGQRYRIIYSLDGEKILILIVGVGIRREGSKTDIYALAKKLVRLGLVSVQESEESEQSLSEELQDTEKDSLAEPPKEPS
jgi:mRNA interferase RelE/StbE